MIKKLMVIDIENCVINLNNAIMWNIYKEPAPDNEPNRMTVYEFKVEFLIGNIAKKSTISQETFWILKDWIKTWKED